MIIKSQTSLQAKLNTSTAQDAKTDIAQQVSTVNWHFQQSSSPVSHYTKTVCMRECCVAQHTTSDFQGTICVKDFTKITCSAKRFTDLTYTLRKFPLIIYNKTHMQKSPNSKLPEPPPLFSQVHIENSHWSF